MCYNMAIKSDNLLRIKSVENFKKDKDGRYPTKQRSCRLCGEKMTEEYCMELWSFTNSFCGHFHEKCLQNAYNIMVLNKI